jgi:hypothetical protein
VNLGELETAVKRYGFDDTDPLYTWIIASIHEFERYTRWPFLRATAFVSTVASTQALTVVGTGFGRVNSIRFRDESIVLTPTSPEVFEEELDDPELIGKPSRWVIKSDTQVDLYPIPDDVYALRVNYSKKITEPVDNPTSVIDVPTTFHYNLVQLAAAIGHDADNNEDRASKLRTQAYSGFDSGISSFYGTTGMFSQVRDSQGYEC